MTDRDEIRRLLKRDPVWAVYALGDLGDELWPKTSWHRAGDELALVLRAFSVPILWSSGHLDELVDTVADEPRYSVQVRPDALPALSRRFQTSGLKEMWRMRLDAEDFRPSSSVDAERLGPEDVSSIEELYQDGADAGEAPEFFYSEMVANGVFFGCRGADGRLASVAGTHLVEPAEGVGAIGNVYTRRDCRGRGLAAGVASAVAAELRSRAIGVIALNVYQANPAAIRVYERLGFRRHCEFVEGIIERLG